jgi:hypothetical protein
MPLTSGMVQEANAWSNAQDMPTWTTMTRMVRVQVGVNKL